LIRELGNGFRIVVEILEMSVSAGIAIAGAEGLEG